MFAMKLLAPFVLFLSSFVASTEDVVIKTEFQLQGYNETCSDEVVSSLNHFGMGILKNILGTYDGVNVRVDDVHPVSETLSKTIENRRQLPEVHEFHYNWTLTMGHSADGTDGPGVRRALSSDFLDEIADEILVALTDYIDVHKTDPNCACLDGVTEVAVRFEPTE